MDATLKDEWVAALESGDYNQGEGFLHYADHEVEHHCALGVLADLMVKRGEAAERVSPAGGVYRYSFGNDAFASNASFIPEDVFGINLSTYSIMNDSGVSFAEIAKVVRRDIPVDNATPVIPEPVLEHTR